MKIKIKMNGEYTWNAQKKELWTLPVKELKDKLEELKKDRLRMETILRADGHSVKRQNYPHKGKVGKGFAGGSIKQIRKAIACIKTMIGVKENGNKIE